MTHERVRGGDSRSRARRDVDIIAHSWTITDGCLVFLDTKGNRVRAFARGNWLEVAPA